MADDFAHIDDYETSVHSDYSDFENIRGGQQERDVTPIPHHPIQNFHTFAALEASMRDWREAYGFEIATRSSEKKDGIVVVRWISCAKGINRKLKQDPQKKKGSKMNGCQFKMKYIAGPARTW
jgi:hypothetical protein